MIIEVCANSIQSAIYAQEAGADRVEICTELAVGGITPSYGLLKQIKKYISIPIHVLIRPRSGGFTYSSIEVASMIENIRFCQSLDFDGVVCGALDTNFEIDYQHLQKFIAAAHGMKFTFHRAFDWVRNPIKALQVLEELEVDYILTSGQKSTAEEGMVLLKKLLEASSSVKIMAGGGVNITNAGQFLQAGLEAIHLSGSIKKITYTGDNKITMNDKTKLLDHAIIESSKSAISSIVKMVRK